MGCCVAEPGYHQGACPVVRLLSDLSYAIGVLRGLGQTVPYLEDALTGHLDAFDAPACDAGPSEAAP